MGFTGHVRALCLVTLFAACSSKSDDAGRKGTGTADASLPSDLVPLFDDLADAITKDLEASTKSPPKSRVGGLEVLVGATPAGFTRHALVLERHGVRAEALLGSESSAVTHQVDRMTVKLEAPMRAFMEVLAALPETSEADCKTLMRRIFELKEQGPPRDAMLPPLGVALGRCMDAVPKPVQACFLRLSDEESPTVAAYDACVAAP